MSSSVKPRYDGGGSEFGDMHRKLPKNCGMFDIDRMKAEIRAEMELKKDETGFVEYSTDFTNAEVTFKALYEIKHKNSQKVQEAMQCKTGTATFAQKKMAERLGMRYFYVIATDGKQPFHFYEMIADEFEFVGTLDYDEDNKTLRVNEFWRKIGLLKLT